MEGLEDDRGTLKLVPIKIEGPDDRWQLWMIATPSNGKKIIQALGKPLPRADIDKVGPWLTTALPTILTIWDEVHEEERQG